MFEQKEIGNPVHGRDLGHIDFAAYAKTVGAQGFRVSQVGELRAVVQAWLAVPGPTVLDVQVNPAEEAVKSEQGMA